MQIVTYLFQTVVQFANLILPLRGCIEACATGRIPGTMIIVLLRENLQTEREFYSIGCNTQKLAFGLHEFYSYFHVPVTPGEKATFCISDKRRPSHLVVKIRFS